MPRSLSTNWVSRHRILCVIEMNEVRTELDRLDVAVYAAVANTRTPRLDRALGRLSQAADFSKLWLGSAAVLALAGGEQGRRAAVNGVASLGLTSAVVNIVLKPVFGRRRPERVAYRLPVARRVRMPRTRSFPSGHSASAAAFATGVASAAPVPGIALTFLAAIVAYSRVHTGVHYPGDVLAGSTVGVALAPVAVAAVNRCRSRDADTQGTRAD
jgi:membrane-associated phospholipid phosphatase